MAADALLVTERLNESVQTKRRAHLPCVACSCSVSLARLELQTSTQTDRVREGECRVKS